MSHLKTRDLAAKSSVQSEHRKSEHKSKSTGKAALWRVIAPFVTIGKRKSIKGEFEEHEQLGFYLSKKPSVLLRDLSSFMSDSVDLPSLFHETAECLKTVTKAAGVNVYRIDRVTRELYFSTLNVRGRRHKIKWKIEDASTVAAFVAKVKDYVLVEDLITDFRFPEGIGYEGDVIVKSVLCLPILTPDGECSAVIELYRQAYQKSFSKDDLRISVMVTAWMGVAIHQNQERLALKRHQELNDYLLNLVKCYFGDTILMEKLMIEIVKFAKDTLGAERGSFFLIDQESNEMVGHLYDENDMPQDQKGTGFRFGKERGIAGLVARTGVTVNIKDAYEDSRFNMEIDEKTGYKTRSILCMPIKGVSGTLGVVQVINKSDGGSFTKNDEILFNIFSLYCAFALHYTHSHENINKLVHLNNIYQKLIHIHLHPCIHDYKKFIEEPLTTIPPTFNEFSWYVNTTQELNTQGPQYCLYIFVQLIDPSEINLDDLMKFILTARNLYRDNPYHNFEHAFSVFHCMYAILIRNKLKFSKLEIKSLLVAAICHDIDHVGYTNCYLATIKDDLAQLYKKSILENHHYQVTLMILKDYNLFPAFSESETKIFHKEIEKAILATDLAIYFENKVTAKKFAEETDFDWEDDHHRYIVKSMMMTACDLSGQCKPFLTAKRITENVYREFYHQGDLEKQMGLCPISIMDRDKKHRIVEDQMQFLQVIVIPCVEILSILLPNTSALYEEAVALRNIWQEIANTRGQKIWRQDDSIVRK